MSRKLTNDTHFSILNIKWRLKHYREESRTAGSTGVFLGAMKMHQILLKGRGDSDTKDVEYVKSSNHFLFYYLSFGYENEEKTKQDIELMLISIILVYK